jgi:NitT/TauT family transport system substrate-binding protein
MDGLTRRAFAERGLLGAAALGLGASLRGTASAQSESPIAIAMIPSEIAAEAWYGEDGGFFKKAGLSPVTIVPLGNGPAIASAVAGGSADFGYSNVISLANAHAKGLNFTILAPANMHVSNAPVAGILAVKKNSTIKTAKDLNGKTIAVTGLGNIADISLRAWIDKNGGDSKSVKVLELKFSEMLPAIVNGRIDAGQLDTVGDIYAGKPDDPLRRIGNTFDAVSTSFAPSVWFTTLEIVKNKPALVKAFVSAMAETSAWANTHRKETAVILAKYTKKDLAAIEGLVRTTYGGKISPGMIQPNIDVAVKYGVLAKSFPASELITTF